MDSDFLIQYYKNKEFSCIIEEYFGNIFKLDPISQKDIWFFDGSFWKLYTRQDVLPYIKKKLIILLGTFLDTLDLSTKHNIIYNINNWKATNLNLKEMDMTAAKRQLVGLQNGLLDLDTLQIRPQVYSDYILQNLPVSFDPDVDITPIVNFFNTVLEPNLISKVKENLGRCLYNGSGKEVCIVLLGNRQSKDVFLRGIKNLFGDTAVEVEKLFLMGVVTL
jgi:hypothetical protein